LGGLFGVGGGVLMVPALVLLIGLTQKGAQTISLAVMVPMAFVAFLRYRHMNGVPLGWPPLLILAAFAVIGANLGATGVSYMSNRALQISFGAFIMVVGAWMIIKATRGA
jgi:uncharacterized membrane protein YfcA